MVSEEPNQSEDIPAVEFPVVRGAVGSRKSWVSLKAKVVGERVVLSGRSFLLMRRTVEVPLDEILNVATSGTVLKFDRMNTTPAESSVVLHMKHPKAVAQLASSLPTVQTPAFAAELSRQKQFVAAFKAATPHVYVTPVMAAICTIVYLAMCVRGADWISPAPSDLLGWGGNHWLYTTAGEWWRLATAGFLHIGLVHLAMNMQALLVAGWITERLFGNRLFALIYSFGLLASSISSIWWSHNVVVAGASGAIFAIFGALLAFLLVQRGSFPKQARGHLLGSAATFILYNLMFGAASPSISNAAHVGGLVSGFVLGLLVNRPLEQAARTHSLKRATLVGLAASTTILAALVGLVPKSWLDIESEATVVRECTAMAGAEQSIDTEFRAALERFDRKELSSTECAALVEDSVLPAWDRAAQGVLAIRVGPRSSEHDKLVILTEYCRLKREIFVQTASALRVYGDDRKNILEWNERMEQVGTLGGDLQKQSDRLSTVVAANAARASRKR